MRGVTAQGFHCLSSQFVAVGRLQDIANAAEFLTRISRCLINVLLSQSQTICVFPSSFPTPPVPSRFLSSVGEMTLSRRVAIPSSCPPPPFPRSAQSFAAFTSMSNQLSSQLAPCISSSFLCSFSSVITCYPRELDPLRFVPEAQRYILSYLSSHFLCLPGPLRRNY